MIAGRIFLLLDGTLSEIAREQVDLLRAFSTLLSTPLERNDNPDDYLPSQKLSSYFRSLGFDGIRYSSAMRPNGANLVLFSKEDARAIESNLFEVLFLDIGKPLP